MYELGRAEIRRYAGACQQRGITPARSEFLDRARERFLGAPDAT
jgi:hypothetical protein